MSVKFEHTKHRIGPVEIIGQSPQTRAMLDFIYQVAANDFPVLLAGETGAGKEVTARAIHFASARASGPFLAVNCGAINHELIESELFGHEKGAFTGAIARQLGRFERANGGTLFLDEIGELPLPDQVKLLRAVQEHRIERVGGTEEIEVDVRIIAATNRNLLDEVGSKNFRQDLYYRLAVLIFIVPPLRDHPDDILPLARHFLAVHCGRLGRQAPSLTTEAEAALLQYHWPGNVRELENVIERAIAHNRGREITAESLIFDARWKPQPATGRVHPDSQEHDESLIPAGVKFDDLALHEKRELIKRALQQSPRDREKAAKLLGLSSRHKLHRRMKKLGIGDVDEE
jgi:two-component system NtrC family response regulator